MVENNFYFISLSIWKYILQYDKKWTVLKYPIHIFFDNFRTLMGNKYTLKFTFAIEIQIDNLLTLALVNSINKCPWTYFSIKCSSVCCYQKCKPDVAKNQYLFVQFVSEFYIFNVNFRFSSLINFSWENEFVVIFNIYASQSKFN